MANTTGTYTTGLVDGTLGLDLGKFLIEQAYVTGVASFLSPAYFAPLPEKSGFAFVSGGITYNLDDIYVRNDYWRQGNLLNWGSNANGQLGNNSVLSTSSPVQTVAAGTTWVQAAGGKSFTAAVKSDGTLWLWGNNAYGNLGDNSITKRSSPVQTISAGTTWWRVSCGYNHTASIKNNGTLWLWGRNNFGQIGDNTSANKSSPVQTVSGGSTWKQVAAGAFHTACIKTDNTLWMFGDNSNGQLGDNTVAQRTSPVQTVSGGTDWKWVACGTRHTAAIKRDGSLWLWGSNLSGALGDNSATGYRSSPVQTISAGTSWKEISCGDNTTFAIKTDSTLWGWGKNDFGQVGDNTFFNKSSPVLTAIGGTAWRRVAVGYSHTIALDYNDQPASIIVPAPPPSTPSCWVARLVYGNTNPRWIVFREWMLNDSPNWFKNTYLKHGEAFAHRIKDKPVVQRLVRCLMNFVTRNKKLSKEYVESEMKKYDSFA